MEKSFAMNPNLKFRNKYQMWVFGEKTEGKPAMQRVDKKCLGNLKSEELHRKSLEILQMVSPSPCSALSRRLNIFIHESITRDMKNAQTTNKIWFTRCSPLFKTSKGESLSTNWPERC